MLCRSALDLCISKAELSTAVSEARVQEQRSGRR